MCFSGSSPIGTIKTVSSLCFRGKKTKLVSIVISEKERGISCLSRRGITDGVRGERSKGVGLVVFGRRCVSVRDGGELRA